MFETLENKRLPVCVDDNKDFLFLIDLDVFKFRLKYFALKKIVRVNCETSDNIRFNKFHRGVSSFRFFFISNGFHISYINSRGMSIYKFFIRDGSYLFNYKRIHKGVRDNVFIDGAYDSCFLLADTFRESYCLVGGENV